MNGELFIARSARLLAALTTVAVAAGCAQPPKPVLVRAGADSTSNIVVLRTSENPVFDAPLNTFLADVEGTVTVYSRPEQIDPDLLGETVRGHKPTLIFALGTKATLVARRLFPDTPLLFAMVVNYKRHDLAGKTNVTGIALEMPPGVEFMMFKMVAADVKRVLTLYAPQESQDLVNEARQAVAGLGVEILAVPVQSADEVAKAWADRPADIDGVWFMNDPVVMNPKTFAFLRDQTQAEKLPFFSSLSDRFAQGGALMSVSVDLTSLGSQAAAMARDVASGRSPAELGIQPPIGSKLVVNQEVADRIGFVIPEDVLPFINEVIVGRAEESPAP